MAMLFENENDVQGIVGDGFQAGVNDTDPGTNIEQNFLLPYVIDKRASWIDYRCTLAVELDPGVVLHKVLPQSQQDIDTLASAAFESGPIPVIRDVPLGSAAGGPTNIRVIRQVKFVRPEPYDTAVAQANTVSEGRYADFVQRMATSRYRFCLKGWAIRAGYRIPIPGLRTVCGVPAIPDWPQKVLSDSEVIANYSGVPLFFAQWELWYFIAVPPTAPPPQIPNVAEHIRGDAKLPAGMQLPYSQTDQNAVESGGLGRVLRPGG